MANAPKGDTPKGVQWLDASLAEKALHLSGETDLKVAGVDVAPATALGDNYASALYRVTAALADGEERSLVVKTVALGEIAAKTNADLGVFPRETTMLASVIPRMQALLEEVAPGRYPQLAPRCLLHGTTPADFLVLEDLKQQGFKMANRHTGLGLRHSLLALRSLAQFHAASVALLARDPSINETLVSPLRRQPEIFGVFIHAGLDAAAKVSRTWPGYEEVADSILKFKVDIVQKLKDLHEPKPGAFNVILHGDFWANNVLYRYENGHPEDIRLVDYQASHIASPALDLLFLLCTSLSEDVAKKHSALLLREYHRTLEEVLALFELPAPSFKQLVADIDAHSAAGVFSSICLLPLLKVKEPMDFDTAAKDVDAAAYVFEDPDIQVSLKRLLLEYKKRGWLPG